MKRLLTLLLFPVSAFATDYYVSPTGSGSSCTVGTPCTMATALSAVMTNDHIKVTGTSMSGNGHYTGASGMLTPSSGRNGAVGQYIVVEAVNEGGVLVDGEGARSPLNLNNNSYWNIIGINFANSVSSGMVMQNGSSNNLIQRVGVWNANLSGNYHVWSIDSGASNTFEDCFGFGTGRTVWDNFNSSGNTFRRIFGDWNKTLSGMVKLGAQLSYESNNTLIENSVFTWNPQSGTDTSQMQNILGTGPNSSRDVFWNVYGTIVYEMPGHAYGTPGDGYAASPYQNELHWTNSVVFVPPDDSTDTLFITNCFTTDTFGTPCASTNNSLSSVSIIGSGSATIGSLVSQTNVKSGSTVTSVYGAESLYVNNGSKGATICLRYVNGSLTGTALWPWPMNQRIVDAYTQAGLTPINVNTDIQAIFGTFPSNCTTPTSIPTYLLFF